MKRKPTKRRLPPPGIRVQRSGKRVRPPQHYFLAGFCTVCRAAEQKVRRFGSSCRSTFEHDFVGGVCTICRTLETSIFDCPCLPIDDDQAARATPRRNLDSEEAAPPLFEAKGLSYPERYNVGALFACLFDVRGAGAARDRAALTAFLERLNLTAKDRQRLLSLSKGHRNPQRYLQKIKEDATRWMILWDLLVLSFADGRYDSRDREGLRRVSSALGIPWARVAEAEDRLASELRRTLKANTRDAPASSGRGWKIAAVTVAGGIAMAVTGGLAAPALGGAIGTYFMSLSGAAATSAGLAWLGGGAVAAGGLGMWGGSMVVSGLSAAVGGGIASYRMGRRTGAVAEFSFERLDGKGMHTFIAASGFLSARADLRGKWKALPGLAGHGEHFVLRWESQHLLALGSALGLFSARRLGRAAIETWARRAGKIASRALRWPALVLSAADIIDNPWHMARDRSEKAGRLLAHVLMDAEQIRRPVTLLGFSLGGRLIFHALEELAAKSAEGIVEHVILMGAAVSADRRRWDRVSTVVAGRLVNAYSPSDWVLGFLYRGAEMAGDVVGIAPAPSKRVVSVDVSDLAPGHLDYPGALDPILRRVGIDTF